MTMSLHYGCIATAIRHLEIEFLEDFRRPPLTVMLDIWMGENSRAEASTTPGRDGLQRGTRRITRPSALACPHPCHKKCPVPYFDRLFAAIWSR